MSRHCLELSDMADRILFKRLSFLNEEVGIYLLQYQVNPNASSTFIIQLFTIELQERLASL